MNTLRKAFYHMKMAQENFEDVVRSSPGTIAWKKSKLYLLRIGWMFTDFKSTPYLPNDALDTFREEMKSDVMFHESISLKALDLSPKQKAGIEKIIDCLLAGENQIIEVCAE